MKNISEIEKVLEGLKENKKQLEKELTFAPSKEIFDDKLLDVQIITKKIYILEETLNIIFEYNWIND